MNGPTAVELINARSRRTIGRDIHPLQVHASENSGVTLDARAIPFPTVRVLEGAAPVPPAVLVDRLILDRDVNLWTGHGGSAKTLLLLTTSIGIVLGRPVFGTLTVHRPGPVLLVVPEDGEAAVRMMLDALVAGSELSPNDQAILTEHLRLIPDDMVVNLTTDTRRLGATARDVGAVAVLMDPLTYLLGGASEREEDVATLVCDSLRRHVCRESEASAVLNHHNRKPGRDNGTELAASVHDARGSGGWANGARLVLGITKKRDDNRITLTGLKANRLRADLRHELELHIVADPENDAHWLSCRVTDANAGATSDAHTPGVGRPLNKNEHAALGCLDDRHEPGRRLAWSRWRDDSGLNPNTFKSIKERLLDARLAIAIPTGKGKLPYRVDSRS